jgi:plastocyanin
MSNILSMGGRFVKRIAFPALLVLAIAGVAGAYVGLKAPAGPPRTVVMSMSDYTFNSTNPTLAFKPGERIHFVVRNDEDSPVRHNFRIVGMDVPCERDLEPGETREVTVTLPRSGEFAYTCCTHPGMGGKLVIEGQ